MTLFSLAKVFADLANDPSWPWTSDNKAQSFVWSNDGHLVAQLKAPEVKLTRFVAQSPLTMARLALMVVEAIQQREGYDIELILNDEGISSDHYASVKKRVEEAETDAPRR